MLWENEKLFMMSKSWFPTEFPNGSTKVLYCRHVNVWICLGKHYAPFVWYWKKSQENFIFLCLFSCFLAQWIFILEKKARYILMLDNTIRCFHELEGKDFLTLSQTSPGFYMFALQNF